MSNTKNENLGRMHEAFWSRMRAYVITEEDRKDLAQSIDDGSTTIMDELHRHKAGAYIPTDAHGVELWLDGETPTRFRKPAESVASFSMVRECVEECFGIVLPDPTEETLSVEGSWVVWTPRALGPIEETKIAIGRCAEWKETVRAIEGMVRRDVDAMGLRRGAYSADARRGLAVNGTRRRALAECGSDEEDGVRLCEEYRRALVARLTVSL